MDYGNWSIAISYAITAYLYSIQQHNDRESYEEMYNDKIIVIGWLWYSQLNVYSYS